MSPSNVSINIDKQNTFRILCSRPYCARVTFQLSLSSLLFCVLVCVCVSIGERRNIIGSYEKNANNPETQSAKIYDGNQHGAGHGNVSESEIPPTVQRASN